MPSTALVRRCLWATTCRRSSAQSIASSYNIKWVRMKAYALCLKYNFRW